MNALGKFLVVIQWFHCSLAVKHPRRRAKDFPEELLEFLVRTNTELGLTYGWMVVVQQV